MENYFQDGFEKVLDHHLVLEEGTVVHSRNSVYSGDCVVLTSTQDIVD